MFTEKIGKYADRFYEEVEQSGYKVVEGYRYYGAKEYTKIECPEGHVYDVCPDNFVGSKNRKGKRCGKCAGVKKLTHSEIEKRMQDQFGDEFTLVSEYRNSYSPMRIRHNNPRCGWYEWDVYIHNVTHKNQKCPKCAGNAPSNTEEFKERIHILTDGEYSVLGEYRNADTAIRIRHNSEKCGNHEWSVIPFNFTTHNSRCPFCNQSQGESKIARFLKSNNFPFESQVGVKGCKNKKRLLFDFAVYIEDELICFIEMQGIQHYKPVKHFGGEKRFIINQINDQIKREFCSSESIPLIEVPYWKMEEIEELLLEELYRIIK